jgi:hypothetical protein
MVWPAVHLFSSTGLTTPRWAKALSAKTALRRATSKFGSGKPARVNGDSVHSPRSQRCHCLLGAAHICACALRTVSLCQTASPRRRPKKNWPTKHRNSARSLVSLKTASRTTGSAMQPGHLLTSKPLNADHAPNLNCGSHPMHTLRAFRPFVISQITRPVEEVHHG